MSLLKDFFGYISRPYFFRSDETFSVKIIPILLTLTLTKLAFVIAAFILTNEIMDVSDVGRPERKSRLSENLSLGRVIAIVILAPFFEELIFRSWLRSRWGIIFFFPLTILLSVWMLARFFQLTASPLIICSAAIGGLAYVIWVYRLETDDAVAGFVNKIFPYVFWTNVSAFALLHLTNYKIEQIGVLGILIVLPQFISGAFYGYIMKHYGFWSCVASHAFWNGSLALIMAVALKAAA